MGDVVSAATVGSPCARCGAGMIPLLEKMVCGAECDLRPLAAFLDDEPTRECAPLSLTPVWQLNDVTWIDDWEDTEEIPAYQEPEPLGTK